MLFVSSMNLFSSSEFTIEKLCILLDCTPNDIFKLEEEAKDNKKEKVSISKE